MSKKKIRVLIVDDSFFMRKFLSDAVEGDPGLEVAGTASDPYEARDKKARCDDAGCGNAAHERH